MVIKEYCIVLYQSIKTHFCSPYVANESETHNGRDYRLSRGFFKEFLELHKRGGLGTEVPQRGPGAEPR